MLGVKPAFSLSSFTLIKRLFSSSKLSVMWVVSSAYLRLLVFLLAILIPAWASPSPAFCMMYSACRAYCVAHLVKNLATMQETLVWFLGWEIPLEKDRLPSQVFLGFPGGSAGKESTQSTRDLGLIPGLGRFPGEGNGYPLQFSGLESPIDCIVHGITKSRKRQQVSLFHFPSHWERVGTRHRNTVMRKSLVYFAELQYL